MAVEGLLGPSPNMTWAMYWTAVSRFTRRCVVFVIPLALLALVLAIAMLYGLLNEWALSRVRLVIPLAPDPYMGCFVHEFVNGVSPCAWFLTEEGNEIYLTHGNERDMKFPPLCEPDYVVCCCPKLVAEHYPHHKFLLPHHSGKVWWGFEGNALVLETEE